jgi:hypothetical protein
MSPDRALRLLLTDPWVSGSARQAGAVAAEGEHGEGNECLRGAESERNPGQESDLGVGGFDQFLGEAVIQGGVDGIAVSDDAACQLHEHRDAAAPRTGDPPVQGLPAFLAFDRKHASWTLKSSSPTPNPRGPGCADPSASSGPQRRDASCQTGDGVPARSTPLAFTGVDPGPASTPFGEASLATGATGHSWTGFCAPSAGGAASAPLIPVTKVLTRRVLDSVFDACF